MCGMTVYVRIREGKFWVEKDWTEDGIAGDLVREGVPKKTSCWHSTIPRRGSTRCCSLKVNVHWMIAESKRRTTRDKCREV